MRSTFHSRKARRRGQALLLAVLIMIFAALLSAAFIGIVAVNLNQTARQTDKNRAVESARAGLDYVNRQLTYSAEGSRWRPTMASKPPAFGSVAYNIYYTALDQAQGWTDKDNYVKFPDPRSNVTSGPQFLAKVEKIPLTTPSTGPDSDKIGALKITVIGLSPDDPTAYHKIVAYKGGYKRAPIAQVMRTVSSYDFIRNSTFVAQADPNTAADGTSSTSGHLHISDARGDFTKLGTPFSITLSKANDPTVVTRTAVVYSVVPGISNTEYDLFLSNPLPAAPKKGERIELAADFGGPSTLDLDNRSSTPPTAFAASVAPVALSDTNALTPTTVNNEVDGARVNNSLIWSGTLAMARLRPYSGSFGTNLLSPGVPLVPGMVEASGVIAPDPLGASVATVKDISSPNSDTLKASDSTGIFSTSVNPNREELVQDSWNRLSGVATTAGSNRSVSEFRPPVIDSGAALERYRDLARNSTGVANVSGNVPQQQTGALYGYGTGIYLDNSEDKEKVLKGGKLQEMDQTELQRLWLGQVPSFDTNVYNYMRTTTPVGAAVPNYSLEEKHLRGWVGPDEFRARGVEIELGNNAITITRDARSDLNYDGADPDKTWKNPANGTNAIGKYTEVLPWPTNGVIFAEGNVRIKGIGTNAPNSLTVVSMGNIYIEDSLSADNGRKILLLAKRNVVMNPTRVLARPDAQTTISQSGAVTAGATTIPVADPLSFKKGDFIQVGTAIPPIQGYVNATPIGTDTVLNVDVTTGGTRTIGDLVFTPNAVTQQLNSTLAMRDVFYNGIVGPSDVLQRRVNIPVGSTLANLRLALNHQGSRVNALSVAAVAENASGNQSPPTHPIYFSNRAVFFTTPPTAAPYIDHSKSVVGQVDRILAGQYDEPTPAGTDKFPGTNPAAPTTDLEYKDPTRYIGAISTAMNAQVHTDSAPNGVSWQYQTSVSDPNLSGLPYFYLAGLSNRLNFGATTVPAERRPNINTDPAASPAGAAYVLPLATSISVRVNNINGTLSDETYDPTLTNYGRTTQFGFRPTFGDTTGPPSIPDEDILTTDQSFYAGDPVQTSLDSRSTYDATATGNGFQVGDNALVMRQSDGIIQPANPSAVNPPPSTLPEYRVMSAKLENVTEGIVGGISTVTGIVPAHDFIVNAYVYAQTGSWFVISGPTYDDRLRGDTTQTFLDTNNNDTPDAGEYIKGPGNTGAGFEVGDFADLNRNGNIDNFEKTAMLRFSRFNYSITFTGAIAENQTPLVNDAGTTAKGAVSDWMSKWITTSYDSSLPTPISYNRIKYIFDPTVVTGKLDDDPSTIGVDETDYGFRLPEIPDLFSVS